MCRKHEVEQPDCSENRPEVLGDCRRATQLGTSANLVCRLTNRNDRDVPDEKPGRSESRPPESVSVNNHQRMVGLDPSRRPPVQRYRQNVVRWFGMGHKIINEVHGNEVETDNTSSGNVEVHNDKVALVCKTNADAGDVAVMVSFENASATGGTVMAALRLVLLTRLAVPPRYCRVVDDCCLLGVV